MNRDYDVIVVGGGPGGSTAAKGCAQAGLKTLLIEKERMPRYKPCGGCLSLKTVQWLDLNLDSIIENTIDGAKFTYRHKDSFFIRTPKPVAFLVMRDRFDQLLVDQAREKGSEILEGEKVTRIREENDGVEVEVGKVKKFRCRFLIGADGPMSLVARSSGLWVQGKDEHGIAIESEVPFDSSISFPESERSLIHMDFGGIPNGYGWVFPKKKWLSVGIGGMFKGTKKVNTRQHFDTFLKGLAYIPEGNTGRVIGHSIPSFYDEKQRISRGRVLLVGDAAHLVDPLIGEGIYYAVRSGMLAAQALTEWKKQGNSPSEWYQEMAYNQLFQQLKWPLRVSRFVFRFSKLAYQALKQYPELGELYLQVLEGQESYQGFVQGIKERIKDLLKGQLSRKIKAAMTRT